MYTPRIALTAAAAVAALFFAGAAPAQAEQVLTIDDRIDFVTAEDVDITGYAACEGGGTANILGRVTQEGAEGGQPVTGVRQTDLVPCDGGRHFWKLRMTPKTGGYSPGRASVAVSMVNTQWTLATASKEIELVAVEPCEEDC